ncbi:MAG: FtsX-like permease family protein [Ferruginibacter sp.]
MITNYFKIAWRNLMKHKVFSFINIFGLSIGLTCCLLITLYLKHELSYDMAHMDSDRIYQLGTTFLNSGEVHSSANTPAPMGIMMKQQFPEIEESVRLLSLFGEDKTLLRSSGGNATAFYETKGFLADPAFFSFFKYDFKEGDFSTALNEPNSIVLNEDIAVKLFGHYPALNKVIHISSSTNGEADMKVTGVFKAPDIPSHIDGRFFIAFKGGEIDRYASQTNNLAFNNMFYTYFRLKKDAGANNLEKKFPAFIEKYAGNDLRAAGFSKLQFLTAVKDIHLRSRTTENVTPPGSMTYLYILGSIALFALLIACINFMNLSTARSSKRAAEVGVRKVLGANNNSLVWQFLRESLLMSIIAFIIALALTNIALPAFSAASGKKLTFSLFQHGRILSAFFVLSVITGLLAGLYPAMYLSSFKPVKILKSKFSNSFATISLRKGLVIFQFIISAILIISSVVIGNQMHFLRSKDLGFAKDQELIIPLRSVNAKSSYRAMKTALTKLPDVSSVGASYYYPGIFNPMDRGLYKEGRTVNDAKITKLNIIDETFIQTLGIQIKAGRSFSAEFPADTINALLLNEEAIKKMGYKTASEAVGKPVFFDYEGKAHPLMLIGVVKDFHFEDLHLPITPYGFQLNSNTDYSYLVVHAKNKDLQQLVSQVGSVWKQFNPNEPFDYNFLDESFQKNYAAQDRLADIVKYFTLIAILISCLGLFGLATFSAEQRIKEIGIRKVMGASVPGIVALLSKDFLKLVAIAMVIASPIAWYIMNKWLQDFAYRVTIGWWVFVVASVVAMLIALITVSFQAIKAAIDNPVKSLRTE